MNLHFVPVITIIRFIWEWKVLASESGKWDEKKGEYITFHVMSRVLLIRLEIDFRHFRVITVRCGNFISMMWEFYLYDLVCLRFAQNE